MEDGTGMASAIMPIYSILWNQNPNGENVGGSYSKWMITEQLREKYHFDGVACTDWNIMFDNPSVESFGGMCWGDSRGGSFCFKGYSRVDDSSRKASKSFNRNTQSGYIEEERINGSRFKSFKFQD